VIPKCRGSNPPAPTGQSESNAYGIGSSPEDVGQIAEGAAVKSVVLSHLTWKADDDYSSWVDEVKKHFSGPVLIAKDLKEF